MAPADSSRVSADVSIQIVASDNIGLSAVGYQVLDSNNQPVAGMSRNYNANGNQSFTINDIWPTMRDNDNNGTWDEPIVANGQYTIEATAFDIANPQNSQTTSVTVNLDNTDVVPPQINSVTFTGGGTCSDRTTCTLGGAACGDNSACRPTGEVTVTVNATDAQTSVARVVFTIDNIDRYADSNGADGWSWVWPTAQFTNASHSFVVNVYDEYNNRAHQDYTFETFNGSADRQAPVVSFDSPPTPDDYSQRDDDFTIQVTATDNLGVTHVDFFLDYIFRQSDLMSPYSMQIDTNGLTAGCHTFSARAYDSANNVGSTEVRHVGIGAVCSGGQGQGPRITNTNVDPRSSNGPPITMTARVVDTDGVQSAVVHIQNPDETDITTVNMTLSCNSNNTICDATATWDPPNPPPDVRYYVDIVATDRMNQTSERENI
jgi:hypothetical protein